MIISLSLVSTSGKALKKRQRLVRDPVLAQMILSGWDMIILWMNSNDFS